MLSLRKKDKTANNIAANTKCYQYLLNAYAFVKQNEEKINNLNVFPIPDADTGTNICFTLSNACRSIKKPTEYQTIYGIFRDFADHALLNARGNSGIIVSEIFNGIASGFRKKTIFNVDGWEQALQNARIHANKSMLKPVEGTILTVINGVSDFLKKNSKKLKTKPLLEFWKEIVEVANNNLQKTVEILPELREANVVDSAGFGLVKIFEGFLYSEKTQKIMTLEQHSDGSKPENNNSNPSRLFSSDFKTMLQNQYGYCNEYILVVKPKHDKLLKTKEQMMNLLLTNNCDSIAIVKKSGFFKIHFHTKTPGTISNVLNKYTEFRSLKIENMNIQAEHNLIYLEEKSLQTSQIKHNNIFLFCINENQNPGKAFLGKDAFLINDWTTHKPNPQLNDILKKLTPSVKSIFVCVKTTKDKKIKLLIEKIKTQFKNLNIGIISQEHLFILFSEICFLRNHRILFSGWKGIHEQFIDISSFFHLDWISDNKAKFYHYPQKEELVVSATQPQFDNFFIKVELLTIADEILLLVNNKIPINHLNLLKNSIKKHTSANIKTIFLKNYEHQITICAQ